MNGDVYIQRKARQKKKGWLLASLLVEISHFPFSFVCVYVCVYIYICMYVYTFVVSSHDWLIFFFCIVVTIVYCLFYLLYLCSLAIVVSMSIQQQHYLLP